MIIRQPIVTAVSWPSTFAGAVVGFVIFLTLSALGLAVAGDALRIGNLSEVGIGGLIWLAICVAGSAYISGMVTSQSAPGLTMKSAGLLNGILAGCLLLLGFTFMTVNVISSGVRAAAGVAGNVAQAGATAVGSIDVGAATQRFGVNDELRALTTGIDRGDLERAISQAVPELNRQQVSSTVDTVIGILNTSRQNITNALNAGDVVGLPDRIRGEFTRVQNELQGREFISNLQGRGLSASQAQEVSRVIKDRVNGMQQRANQAFSTVQQRAGEVVEGAGSAVARTAWSWLFLSGIIIGLSALGGYRATDEHALDEYLEEARKEERVHH